jgi:hypothetical protein
LFALVTVKFPKATRLPIAPLKVRSPVPTINIRPPGPSKVDANVTLPADEPPVTSIVNVPAATVVGPENVKLAPGAMIFVLMIADTFTLIVFA